MSLSALWGYSMNFARLHEREEEGGAGEGEGFESHIPSISLHFLTVPKPRETDLPIPK